MEKNLSVLLQKIGMMLMNSVQMGLSYEDWGQEISYKEILRDYQHIKEHLREAIGDITALSGDELKELGFMKSEEDELY